MVKLSLKENWIVGFHKEQFLDPNHSSAFIKNHKFEFVDDLTLRGEHKYKMLDFQLAGKLPPFSMLSWF